MKEETNYQNRKRINIRIMIITDSSLLLLLLPLSVCTFSPLPSSLSLLHLQSLSDNPGDTQGLPNIPPLSPSLHPLASLVNGCQSELGPHADWQQVSSCSRNNYDWAAVKMDSCADSPHCTPLLPADGVLPWEAIIARCQLTARFYCQWDQPSSSGFL